MSKRLTGRNLKILLAGGALLFIFAGVKGALPWPNKRIWWNYFSYQDLEKPEVRRSLRTLSCVRDPKTFQIEALDVYQKHAALGVDGLPSFLELAGEQRLAFLVSAHVAVLPVAVIKPCYDSACRIIHEIRDPRAIPYFKKMLNDDDIRLRAIAKSVLAEIDRPNHSLDRPAAR